MKYFIISGEASGDLHGAGLVRAIHETDSDATIEAWGGDKMESAGATILKHYKELAFMGFVEVVKNLGTILSNLRLAKRQILDFQPDALILVDYPGFNLRIAKWASDKGIKVYYYISPQLWAWKEGRIKTIREHVRNMYVILPFEKVWYSERGVEVSYVGHPLVEAINRFRNSENREPNADEYVALLPGSRLQEIRKMLPVMLEVAEMRPREQFRVAAAPHIDQSVYEQILAKAEVSNVKVDARTSYEILSGASDALTTSGTATLETALFGIPQVVCYKGNALSFEIAKRLVKVPFISLVNLIAGKPVVEELIQENFNAQHLNHSLDQIRDPEIRAYIIDEYNKLESRLDLGGASLKVASDIYQSLDGE